MMVKLFLFAFLSITQVLMAEASDIIPDTAASDAFHSTLVNGLIILIVLMTIRILYFKFTKRGKAYARDLKKMKSLEKMGMNSLTNIYNRANMLEHNRENDIKILIDENISAQNLEMENKSKALELKSTKISKQFQLKFVKSENDEEFILIDTSQNFLNLYSVTSFMELKGKYAINHKFSGKAMFADEIELLHRNVLLSDVFTIDDEEFNKIMKFYNDNINTSETINIIQDSVCMLNTILLHAKVYITYDVSYNGKHLIFEFNINKIVPKIIPVSGQIQLYDANNIINTILIELTYPFFIVDHSGIKFCNKCACDWLNIPYNKTSSDNQVDSITYTFSKIDKDLPNIILDMYNSNSMDGYFNQYIINKDDTQAYVDIEKGLSIIKLPKEISIQCVPYFTVDNKREIIIALHDSKMFKDYMLYINSLSNTNTNVPNKDIDDMIDKLMEVNKLLKTFFKNTEMVSFARINLENKDIIICNKSFEELLKFDEYKDRYTSIINTIIDNYNPENEKTINYYSYDINYADRETKIIYTYSPERWLDIIILEKNVRKFLSNHSLDILESFYETSDLPIVIVNKTGKIIKANSRFVFHFINDEEQITAKQISDMNYNLLDFVPEMERNKAKRAIYDAIKYNSYMLSDNIIMTVRDIDQQFHQCKLSCIKTYGKVDQNEFITITLFPE